MPQRVKNFYKQNEKLHISENNEILIKNIFKYGNSQQLEEEI